VQQSHDASRSRLIAPSPRKMRQLARERFLAGRKAETQYGIQLRRVARHIGDIVRGVGPQGELFDGETIITMLHRYGEILVPWARSVAARMIADVSARDAAAWSQHGRLIGRALKIEIAQAPTGLAMQRALAEQVHLITSLPLETAERVHKLTTEGLVSGRRAADIAKEIMASGEVSRSRAMLIARTETSRTATELTKARAEYIGSEGYTWGTSRDGDVRPSHKAMQGKFVRWDSPPTLDNMVGHAGQFPNCRCYCADIQMPERI
jgi:SPP1 gp7 family putative phage head morphogenesis protein